MSLISCRNCGCQMSDKSEACPMCGMPIDANVEEYRKVVEEKNNLNTKTPEIQKLNENTTPQVQSSPSESSINPHPQKKKNNTWLILVVIAVILLLGGSVGGWFYYKNIYLPKKIDAEAPRYYTFAHILNLRNSKSSGAEYNKVAELPYGTELITYEHDSEWSKVKTSTPGYDGKQQEGFVSSYFILNKHDFFLLNSIFGDTDSKEVISSAKCRIALLNYFKEKGYVGKISEQERLDAGIIEPNSNNQWQVFSKSKNAKNNTTYYKRIVNPDSKFTDFAVIIKNINTGDRKLLYFTFDDDEKPSLYEERSAPREGDIKKISSSFYGYLDVLYSDN